MLAARPASPWQQPQRGSRRPNDIVGHGDNLNQVHVIGTLDYGQRSSMLNVGLSCPLQGADLSVHSISSLTFDAEAAKKHALSAIIVLEIAHGC